MIKDNPLFHSELVNRGRQIELDFAKGLAIVFMLLIHCFQEFSAWPPQPTIPTFIISFLGSPPAAPVFMFALGIGIVYSRKSSPKNLLLRGVRLLILGFVLNFFRDFLPDCTIYLRTGDESYLQSGINYLFGIDILAFAGLVFLFFAAAAKLKFKNAHYALAAALFAGANLLVSGTTSGTPVVNTALGLLWGTNENTWFPFLTWIPYPISGYLFGQLLVRCTDKKRFYKTVLSCAFPVLCLFLVYSVTANVDFGAKDGIFQEPYFHHSLIGNIVMISFVCCWTGMLYFLSRHMPDIVMRTFSRWSRNITTIYCVHWIIIGWSLAVIEHPLPLPWILLYFVGLVIVSDIVSVLYLKLKSGVISRIETSRGKARHSISA